MTTTNELVVVSVAPGGVVIGVNGTNRTISWVSLRAAAKQDDAELSHVYAGVLAEAEAIAADGPVDVVVEQDSTNVWWVCRV